MKKIYLAWYKLPFGKTNFGDELSPYIIKKLTGSEVVYMPNNEESIIKKMYLYLKLIYVGVISINGFVGIVKYFIEGKSPVIYAIGSIIRINKYRRSIIWGSGIISRNEYIKDSNFLAVRGIYTQKRIIELGYDAPEVFGDPALLLPVVHNVESRNKKYTLGIIPHIVHYEEVSSMNYDKNFKIINLNDPIEKIIVEITSCEKTISSSLHGIIVSHAYGIPSLWVSLSTTNLAGDDIKFADYFSSVNINEYLPFQAKDQNSDFYVERLFDANRHISLPDKDIISKRQKELLKCAPFEVVDDFKKKLL